MLADRNHLLISVILLFFRQSLLSNGNGLMFSIVVNLKLLLRDILQINMNPKRKKNALISRLKSQFYLMFSLSF